MVYSFVRNYSSLSRKDRSYAPGPGRAYAHGPARALVASADMRPTVSTSPRIKAARMAPSAAAATSARGCWFCQSLCWKLWIALGVTAWSVPIGRTTT
jgi:hypothetical protein